MYFDTSSYTLFQANSYSAGAPGNFEIELPNDITLINITFPSNQVVFDKASGEAGSENTLVVSSSNFNETRTVTVNEYGVVSISK